MRKPTAVLLVGAAVAVLIITISGGTAMAAGKFKTVTRNFSNLHLVTINDSTEPPTESSPYPSTIKVRGLDRGHIKDVNLRLFGYSHDYPDDVDVLLVSPGGKKAKVMSDVGGGFSANGVNVLLDDSSVNPLPDEGALFSGTYFPTNYVNFTGGTDSLDPFPSPAPAPGSSPFLSNFDGTNPNGTWKLFVVDDDQSSSGSLGGWSLTIKAKVRR
ncbi:MAG TPA: proprotein convertase P-domain-containing protein [Rubrobacter sp.]